ncbi:MAG TPA: class I SAM-dependent methyltransferase [Candidatus Limnocylindria bacterium]|nr:class I SAM-dependent methyltransferase [Candidatus Limnocylindria bacterium]
MQAVDVHALDAFKAAQRQGWAHFAPLEAFTTPPAARLVRFAGVRSGQHVLDVGCGTGVVAVTAALQGAKTTGLDLTPELLDRARENARTGSLDIDWHEGDAEQLPFADREFDVVLSQFGHMFAPQPDVTIAEMLRVLKPGGTIAFSTWPPELFTGRVFALVGRYMPPPPPGVSPPGQWGDPNLVRERLGSAVKDLSFERDLMLFPALSPRHQRHHMERTAGPVLKLVAMLESSDPAKLEAFRSEYESLASEYFENNTTRQSYLMTRAVKL